MDRLSVPGLYLGWFLRYSEISRNRLVPMIPNLSFLIAASSVSAAFPLLPMNATLFQYIRTKRTLIFLFAFFGVAVITEVALYVHSLNSIPSGWIFHLFTFIEYLLIVTILSRWQIKPRLAILMRLSIIIFILLFVILRVAGLEDFSAHTASFVTRPVAVLSLCILAFITLHNLWQHTPASINKDYRFWMLLAMVLYYSASLGLFAFMFTDDRDLLVLLFKIHAVVNIIHNILFTIGVLQIRRLKPKAELAPNPDYSSS